METLKGFRKMVVVHDVEPVTSEEVSVRQIPLREYEEAFKAVDSDEFELVALVVGKSKDWVFTLAPDSYEALLEAVKEVNEKGFFVYSARQQKRLLDRMNGLKPEVLAAAAAAVKVSSVSPLGLRPR